MTALYYQFHLVAIVHHTKHGGHKPVTSHHWFVLVVNLCSSKMVTFHFIDIKTHWWVCFTCYFIFL